MFKINSKVTREILAFFFLNVNAHKYINELAKILNLNLANLDKKLKELEKDGLLLSEYKGKQRYYFLNKKYHLLREVKKIFEIQYGLKEELKGVLKKIKGIEEVFIFGSFACDKMTEESDIDLFLIGSHSSIDVKRVLAKIQKKRQREINTVDMDRKEFEKRKKNHDEFLENIFDNKIIQVI